MENEPDVEGLCGLIVRANVKEVSGSSIRKNIIVTGLNYSPIYCFI